MYEFHQPPRVTLKAKEGEETVALPRFHQLPWLPETEKAVAPLGSATTSSVPMPDG